MLAFASDALLAQPAEVGQLILNGGLTTSGLGALHLSPVVNKFLARRALRRFCSRERVLCLTFDDGPSPILTPQLLDILGEHKIQATFFMIGTQALRQGTLVDQVAASGHEIGCHTMDHLHAWKALPWRVVKDIAAGYEAMARWIPSNGLFRPPFGKLVLQSWLHIRRRGAPLVWWTHDSGDTFKTLPHPKRIVEQTARDGGGVALLHDKDRSDSTFSSFVRNTTRDLINIARTEGFRFLTAGKILEEMSKQ